MLHWKKLESALWQLAIVLKDIILDVSNANRISSFTGRVYQQFENKQCQRMNSLPDHSAVLDFWGKLWGVSKQHVTSAEWLTNLQKKYLNFSEQDNITITEADIASRVKRMANWKTPGLDCVQVY